MGDLAFAKQFLNTLDSKPTKYQPEHVFDPKTFQLRGPYTLAKLSHPPHPLPPKTSPSVAPAPGSEAAAATLTVVLKSPRNPHMTLSVPAINPSTTSIQALKESVQSHLGGPAVVNLEKIKILLNKKPIPASKRTVADALDAKEKIPAEVEFGVMVMGGAPDPPPQVPSQPAPAVGDAQTTVGPGSERAAAEAAEKAAAESTPMEGVEPSTSTEAVRPGEISGTAVLEQSAFWDDLQGFLEQRIRNSGDAAKLRGLFERAWRSGTAAP